MFVGTHTYGRQQNLSVFSVIHNFRYIKVNELSKDAKSRSKHSRTLLVSLHRVLAVLRNFWYIEVKAKVE